MSSLPGKQHPSSHASLPGQFIMGIIFMAFGIMFILKLIGKDYVPFIPQPVFIWTCAVGSVVGGFYLVIHHLWRPRIYL